MRVSRFFVASALAVDTEVIMPAETAHYMANVLRLVPQTPVVLFNGDGNEYSGVVTQIGKRQAVVYLDAKLAIDPQSSLSLHLGQAVSKGDRMDWVLQKATELGVTHITPVITERCAVKLSAERWDKKLSQWAKIIQAACEQSGRNTLPVLNSPVLLHDWLKTSSDQTRLLFDPMAHQRIQQLESNSRGFRILIGPEGGLSQQEVYTAVQNGYQALTMGPRVLRTETAAVAAISILQASFGDI